MKPKNIQWNLIGMVSIIEDNLKKIYDNTKDGD